MNSTVNNPALSVGIVQTATARNVVPTENSFWVLYGSHTEPTYLENAGNGQALQREYGLTMVRSFRNAIDVGANVGEWTRPLAKQFAKVICFEPNPNFRECFNRNIHEPNVELHPYGLSSHEHTVTQGFNATHLNGRIGDTNPQNGDIQCKTLDSFNLTDVDYIKIDVDGFEVPVLKGAARTLQKNSPVINIEMKKTKRPKIVAKAQKILHRWGYRFQGRTRSDEIWTK